jgi:GTPase involved in cell partitioning and DNA repair
VSDALCRHLMSLAQQRHRTFRIPCNYSCLAASSNLQIANCTDYHSDYFSCANFWPLTYYKDQPKWCLKLITRRARILPCGENCHECCPIRCSLCLGAQLFVDLVPKCQGCACVNAGPGGRGSVRMATAQRFSPRTSTPPPPTSP